MRGLKEFSLLAVSACLLLSGQASAVETKPVRQIIVARSEADYDFLKGQFVADGGTVVKEMKPLLGFVVTAPREIHSRSAALASARSRGLYQVAADRVRHLIRPGMKREFFGTEDKTDGSGIPALKRIQMSVPAVVAGSGSQNGDFPRPAAITADPAFSLSGLMWNYLRINADDAWGVSSGISDVRVGVADTGLDYTHSELSGKVSQVFDLTDTSLCKDYYGKSDADLADYYGVPSDIDFNGHGTWIGGNIAAVVDGHGINGIAPGVKLVSLKISEWCGSAYDSSIISSFIVAAENGIDVVSISFGGYSDSKDPYQKATLDLYKAVVAYARKMGTVIVSSAGNDHVRIDASGKVSSHGILMSTGNSTADDYFGLYETPAGVKGVVMVSATGNNVESPSASCAAGTTGANATCKLATDTHQSFGAGLQDQLAYYSNYGPRIDIAAPGGARKFNLPYSDGGGTPGWPVTTADGYSSWEEFSITSNYAQDMTCYSWPSSAVFPANQCYTNIQGTSMATPHVSAAIALVASVNSSARYKPDTLIKIVKANARKVKGNKTPPLSAADKSAGDLTGEACASGYCHLGGKAISDKEAYGAGIVDVYKAVNPKASRIQ